MMTFSLIKIVFVTSFRVFGVNGDLNFKLLSVLNEADLIDDSEKMERVLIEKIELIRKSKPSSDTNNEDAVLTLDKRMRIQKQSENKNQTKILSKQLAGYYEGQWKIKHIGENKKVRGNKNKKIGKYS